MVQLRFDDRVVLVTGAGRGIGRSHALLLARRGAYVVVADAGTEPFGTGSDPTAATLTVDAIRAKGGRAIATPPTWPPRRGLGGRFEWPWPRRSSPTSPSLWRPVAPHRSQPLTRS
jgi:NAD(P)-dependent dehydrogenase (short-subunit alcohol dehydrogenase family)